MKNTQKQDKNTPIELPKLEENVHYYLENGLFVLTELFLRERGYCCKSGCRHCPYTAEKEKLL